MKEFLFFFHLPNCCWLYYASGTWSTVVEYVVYHHGSRAFLLSVWNSSFILVDEWSLKENLLMVKGDTGWAKSTSSSRLSKVLSHLEKECLLLASHGIFFSLRYLFFAHIAFLLLFFLINVYLHGEGAQITWMRMVCSCGETGW